RAGGRRIAQAETEVVVTAGNETAPSVPPGAGLLYPGGQELRPEHDLSALVVIDGTWPQAKSLWWRNPWLRRLPRMTLDLREPSIYGRLRPEPSRRHVSTLEAAAAALTACGESAEVETALRRIFRTLVQRCRDAPDLKA
ncbi:MAG: DTW domain-containing protein, partial [Acidobacteriota bacterium]